MSPKDKPPDENPPELASPRSWVELMALKRLDDTTSSSDEPEKTERFRSLAAPFPPGEGTRSFGGHVYAQSAYAAAQTVRNGFVVHVSLNSLPHTYPHTYFYHLSIPPETPTTQIPEKETKNANCIRT